MAPDVNQSTSLVTMNTSDEFESSYSEVEVSIESDRAMSNGQSSSSEEEEESETDYREQYRGEYEELEEVEEVVVDEIGDLFSDANWQQSQQRMPSDNAAATAAPKSSSNVPKFPSKPVSERKRQDSADTVRNRVPPIRNNKFVRADREKIQQSSSKSMSTGEAEDIVTSSSSDHGPKKQPASPKQQQQQQQPQKPNSKRSNSHKSIKIPALHNNKQDGDDNYIKRKIQQENIRRSRSLSRSENSGTSGHKQQTRHRRNWSNSNSKQSGSQQSRSNSKQSGSQQSSSEGNNKPKSAPLNESFRGNNNSGSSNSSRNPQRSSSVPTPRRLASIHTSTPSNQLTGSTTRSSNASKHSNFDGSKRVSWKSDPKASFSDWTLQVFYRDSNRNKRIDVYHVHRNVVGFGHRKSNYLLRDIMEFEIQEFIDTSNKAEVEIQEIINSDKKSNSNSGGAGAGSKQKDITRIKVPNESQARSVPMVLDFMYYTNETKQRMSADRSCNVFKVAEGLEVQALQKAIGEFYMKNLSLKNLGEFLTAATKVKADKLLTICKAKIGQMITVKPELSAMVPPKFMAEILSVSSKQLIQARAKEPQRYTDDLIVSQSRYWSKAACICAAKNEHVMTQKLFQKLTAEECLPYIDVSATPKLLSMESNFLDGTRPSGQKKSKQLTSLQRRCVESIGNDFDAFQQCFDNHQEIAEALKHLPSAILSEILMKLLTRS
jgi:hypothetical protein